MSLVLESLRERAELDAITDKAIEWMADQGRPHYTADIGYVVSKEFLIQQLAEIADAALEEALIGTELIMGPLADAADATEMNAWTDKLDEELEAEISRAGLEAVLPVDFRGNFFIDSQIHIPETRADLRVKIAKAAWASMAKALEEEEYLIQEVLNVDRLHGMIGEAWNKRKKEGRQCAGARIPLNEFFALIAPHIKEEDRNPKHVAEVIKLASDENSLLRWGGLRALGMPKNFDVRQWDLNAQALTTEFLKFIKVGAAQYKPLGETKTCDKTQTANTEPAEAPVTKKEVPMPKKSTKAGMLILPEGGINYLRDNCGFTTGALSALFGVSAPTISNWAKRQGGIEFDAHYGPGVVAALMTRRDAVNHMLREAEHWSSLPEEDLDDLM